MIELMCPEELMLTKPTVHMSVLSLLVFPLDKF